jgi:glucosamine--fructose-6-phosphate aminotransferase (isomerizing)
MRQSDSRQTPPGIPGPAPNLAGFRADVLSGPDALEAVARAYGGGESPLRALPADRLRGRRLLLIGMGSSKYAADTVAALLRAQGVDAHAELASTDLPQPPGPDTVAFVVSASGGSAETVEAMRRHRGTSLVVAVTNRPDGSLAAGADVVLPVLAGEEAGGIACTSYRCTLAVLLLATASGTVVGDVLEAAGAGRALLGSRDEWLMPLVDMVEGGLGVWVAAPAARLGVASQSALMLREAPRIVAAACETGDWLHVDVYLTKRPGYRLLLLAGSRYDGDVMTWQRERGFLVVSVGSPPASGAALTIDYPGSASPVTAALVESAVAELLAAELWERNPI